MDGVQAFFTAKDVTGSNELISMEAFAPLMGVDPKMITPEQVRLVKELVTKPLILIVRRLLTIIFQSLLLDRK